MLRAFGSVSSVTHVNASTNAPIAAGKRICIMTTGHLSTTPRMTKAADELHIAQSAVSAAVSQLEHQIGTQLFIRHRARGLVLTAAGEEMLRDTRALLVRLVREYPAVPEYRADLASLCGGSRENVTRILSDFQRRRLVERDGRRFVLLKISGLARLAGL